MVEDALNEVRDRASKGGKVFVGVAGDANTVMRRAKEAAAAWGSRAVSGDDGSSWYVRVKMGHVIFQPLAEGDGQDYRI